MAFGLFKRPEKKSEAAVPRYHELPVKEIIAETRDAITIVFNQPVPALPYQSGQFLTLIVPINGKEVRRAYSLCSAPGIDADLAVTVKRVENGLMSNWLPDHLKPGQRLKIMEPMGHFTTTYKPDQKRHLMMFAGGSGITPMFSIIKSLLTHEPQSIVSLIYCNRNIDSIIFKDALTEWQTRFTGRLHVIYVLDEAPMNWQGYSGLLNRDMLTQLLERIPDWGVANTTYLMCGPEGMMRNVEALLIERHIPADKIFKESFVQGTIDKPVKAEAPRAESKTRQVVIRFDGQEFTVAVPPDKTILETALDQGIDLPYSCQSGLCTACRGRALSGEVKLDEEEGLSQSERAEGYVLTCVGHPLTDDVIIEIG